MRLLVMALIVAATILTWSPSSGAVLGMEHGFTLGATGAAVDCDDTECVVYGTGTFQLTVDAAVVPAGGYDAFQASVTLRDHCPDRPRPCVRELTHLPRGSCGEVVWPDVGYCRDTSSPPNYAIYASTGEEWPVPHSSFDGTLLELDVRCSEVGLHRVSFGALYQIAFLLSDGYTVAHLGPIGERGSGSLDVDCREASDEPRPTPTPVPTLAPTPTLAVGECHLAEPWEDAGDPNCDGQVNAIDALLVLQHDAGMAELPDDYAWNMADVNNDCYVTAVDALLILQYDSMDYYGPTPEQYDEWLNGTWVNRFWFPAYAECPPESGRLDVY